MLARSGSLPAWKHQDGCSTLREARFARGEGRIGARHLAGGIARPARAAREALSGDRRRPAAPRPSTPVGEPGRPGGCVASRDRRGARHAVRDRRGEPPPSPASSRPARLHPLVRRVARRSRGCRRRGSSRHFAEPPSAEAFATACSTASVSSAWVGPSRPRARSRQAARAAPRDVEAQVADAVGRFDKDAPGARVRPPRAAHAHAPERADGALPPRCPASLDGAHRGGRSASSGSRRARSRGSPLAREAARYLDSHSWASLRLKEKGVPVRGHRQDVDS